MTRTLLNTFPNWALFLIFVGGVATLSVAGHLFVRRLLPRWRTDESSQIAANVASMVMTLFALVLAFAAVNLYQGYNDASNNVADEANSLSQLTRDVRVFAAPDQARINRAIGAYIHEVRFVSFPAMHKGHADSKGDAAVDGLFNAMESIHPQTETQRAFYDSAVSKLNDVVALRRNRLAAATSSLPGPFVALLLLTAAMSVGITFFLKTHTLGLEIALVSAVSIVVAAGLLTIVLLEFPFSGTVSVSSDPFAQGALARIVAAYP